MEALLEVQSITKTFSGVTAVKGVSMRMMPGKVTALIGENGAGKSTLLKIMSGIYTDFDGTISFKGSDVKFETPRDAQNLGIAIIHQELNLIPHLTVAQNIFMGRELVTGLGFLDQDRMNHKTAELMERLQLSVAPLALISSLKVGQQQVVEIAKALLTESDVFFMDEPTSAIGEKEVEVLHQLIEQLKAEGKSIVYISHKLDELFAIADEYVVLRDGEVVGQGEIKEISRDGLIDMMAGRKVEVIKQGGKQHFDQQVLRVENLCLKDSATQRPVLHDIHFDLRKGEVLGIYGLMGAGRTELCESLFGLHSNVLTGNVWLCEKNVHFKSPGQAMEAGMALVPEDRKNDGIVPGMSVAENMSLTVMDKVEKGGLLSQKLESSLYQKYVSSLRIKVEGEHQLIRNLSGGNQQKVVLAKWIERSPKVLILDEPTRGIDVNAKNEIYALIAKLSSAGMSVMVVSSEIPEILAVSDRILVMSEGHITGAFSAEEANENSIMNACIPEKRNQ